MFDIPTPDKSGVKLPCPFFSRALPFFARDTARHQVGFKRRQAAPQRDAAMRICLTPRPQCATTPTPRRRVAINQVEASISSDARTVCHTKSASRACLRASAAHSPAADHVRKTQQARGRRRRGRGVGRWDIRGPPTQGLAALFIISLPCAAVFSCPLPSLAL